MGSHPAIGCGVTVPTKGLEDFVRTSGGRDLQHPASTETFDREMYRGRSVHVLREQRSDVEVANAVASGDRSRSEELWRKYDQAMRRHFDMEEQVLFPALEDAMNMHGSGPTAVMRSEHAKMRGVLDQMADAAARGEFDAFLDHGDTLLMLVQQHNVKEEGILYPMAGAHLQSVWGELSARLPR